MHQSCRSASQPFTCSRTAGSRCPSAFDPRRDDGLHLGLAQVHVRRGRSSAPPGVPADDAARLLQLARVVGGPALLADVAVLVAGAAVRAGALHEAVGQEAPVGLAVELLDRLLVDEPLRLERVVDAVGPAPVLVRVGRVVGGEVDPESLEVLVLLGAPALHEVLGADARPWPRSPRWASRASRRRRRRSRRRRGTCGSGRRCRSGCTRPGGRGGWARWRTAGRW